MSLVNCERGSKLVTLYQGQTSEEITHVAPGQAQT